ncbi:MAG: glutamate racemase [Bacteroidales bacterium]|nr:glutamate racemase [Bacteroidales bacterium]
MANNNPIGIFDSGVGGLSIFKELIKRLPYESVVYFADSANCPYGPKQKDEIINLSVKAVDFLLSKKCKIVIVACNTATAAAISFLRNNYKISFIGMEPAVKPASIYSKTQSIAVLATEGTFNGDLYKETSEKYAKGIDLNIKVGDKLVGIVENGLIEEPESLEYITDLIKPLLKKKIDKLVLGCTHYPFLIPALRQILPSYIEIIDPSPAVIRQLERVLLENNILNNKNENAKYDFFSSGDTHIMEKVLSSIIQQQEVIKV